LKLGCCVGPSLKVNECTHVVHGPFFMTSGVYPRGRMDTAFLECHLCDMLLHVLANCAQKLFGKQSLSFNRQP